MDLINTLYSEYINDSQYVYYKDHNTIIIMKRLTDNSKCLSEIKPKKYHSDHLKVILMFNITDPYKLVSNLQKYKINELTESNYYESVKEAYTLHQIYYRLGQKHYECNYINGKYIGKYQEYCYGSGELIIECHY